jgi:4-alpha-glucanotransferase
MNKRGSGILLHITSLPSPYGIGDLGPGAYRFADFLAQSRQRFWQVLPLNPTDQAFGNSPYSSNSAFAGNALLISPELLLEEGLIDKQHVGSVPSFPQKSVDYPSVIRYKEELFNRTYEHMRGNHRDRSAYEQFCAEKAHWLDNFSLFMVIKRHFQGKVWSEWKRELRDRNPEHLRLVKEEFCDEFEKEKFLQYLFWKQWGSLKRYCNEKGIHLIGDMPIYANYDSAGVWAHPEVFKLNEEKRPAFVGGVPPDYFSKTGQFWGNPVYRWDVLRETGYRWWIRRVAHNLVLFDTVRIDHFRGFVAFWEISATESTAANGHWVEAPAEDFFTALTRSLSNLSIIAEDLGTITPDVKEIMKRFGFPGMRVLLFAFGEDLPTHPYLPHNYVPDCVVYTGTHDNNTVRGWFENEAHPSDKQRLFRYLGREVSAESVHWDFIRLAMMSIAETVIFPMQDVLGLGEEARMNRPARHEGNWEWRLLPQQLTPSLRSSLSDMTETYGRAV